ncbi:MAG: C4-dicarboxylate ABC transporter [Rhodobacterales bacterium]|nr:MAG: C4-dicarboxylate ABC transporter [Rhodobacterales bacterium]
MSDSQDSRLAHFPVTFFAITMGLGGLTLAFHAAGHAVPWSHMAFNVMLVVTLAVFATISAFYVTKWLRHGAAARGEWHHPVKIAFFPTIAISILLMSTALTGINKDIALWVWAVGAAAQFVLTIAVISSWIDKTHYAQGHLTPAWFIPAVGNVIVPLAGVPLGFPEISWYFFAVGVTFWIILLTLVFNRLVFHDPIPARLFPSLVILIAPPAVAFVSWVRLTGEIDAFARILLNAGYFFAALNIVQVPKLAKLPFALSFWALSFPLAALTVASFLFGRETGSNIHTGIGLALLALLTVTVAGLALRTLKAIARNEICKPE